MMIVLHNSILRIVALNVSNVVSAIHLWAKRLICSQRQLCDNTVQLDGNIFNAEWYFFFVLFQVSYLRVLTCTRNRMPLNWKLASSSSSSSKKSEWWVKSGWLNLNVCAFMLLVDWMALFIGKMLAFMPSCFIHESYDVPLFMFHFELSHPYTPLPANEQSNERTSKRMNESKCVFWKVCACVHICERKTQPNSKWEEKKYHHSLLLNIDVCSKDEVSTVQFHASTERRNTHISTHYSLQTEWTSNTIGEQSNRAEKKEKEIGRDYYTKFESTSMQYCTHENTNKTLYTIAQHSVAQTHSANSSVHMDGHTQVGKLRSVLQSVRRPHEA